MNDDNRAVQVPVSQPTREQIAARLRGDIFDAVPDDNDMQHVLSLAAALLSQLTPTPTTEPCERCGGTGYQGDGPFSMGVPCPSCTAEPPRIEDVECRLCGFPLSGHTKTANCDPSTIRDVQPPKDAA